MLNVGDKYIYHNKRTGEYIETEIVEVKYRFDRSIKSRNLYNEDEINELIEQNVIVDDLERYKHTRIQQLEDELGIKLKEVK